MNNIKIKKKSKRKNIDMENIKKQFMKKLNLKKYHIGNKKYQQMKKKKMQ